jgi:hypothetical protein
MLPQNQMRLIVARMPLISNHLFSQSEGRRVLNQAKRKSKRIDNPFTKSDNPAVFKINWGPSGATHKQGGWHG